MSATTTTAGRQLPRHSKPSPSEPLALRVIEWAVCIPVIGFLGLRVGQSWPYLRAKLPEFLAWLLIVAVTDLMPIPLWGTVLLTMSLPVLLAAGMIYEPWVVGLLALLGCADLREVRREISLPHALYNRSQIALSVMAASLVFHLLRGDVGNWPFVLAVAFPALVADFLVNTVMVMAGTRLVTRLPVATVLRNVHGGAPLAFMFGYACFGLVAVVLATAFRTAGNWGMVAFIIPVLLARQMFAQGQRLIEASRALEEKSRLLLSVSSRIADERREERLTVAAGLHDEVLPPLYQVHLMGQVLRQDLASGRLLSLEDDLPQLLKATEYASEAMRILIRDLRRSSLGPGGLSKTLILLARDLSAQSGTTIHVEVEDVGGSPLVQLLAYQVAREALRNAVRHSQARSISVRLMRESGDMRLVVQDDGRGFALDLVDGDAHFGLQLMKERVELAGGVLQIVSRPGGGTQVVARLPAETTTES